MESMHCPPIVKTFLGVVGHIVQIVVKEFDRNTSREILRALLINLDSDITMTIHSVIFILYLTYN